MFCWKLCPSQKLDVAERISSRNVMKRINAEWVVPLSRGQRSTNSDSMLITHSFIKAAASEPGAAGYIGCFSTSDQWDVDSAHLSPARNRKAGEDVRDCVADCWEQRLRLAIIGRGTSCLCGGLLTLMLKADPAMCQAPCKKNATEVCGGTTALDVYYTGYLEEPTYDIFPYGDIKKGVAEFEGWKPKVPTFPWMRPSISGRSSVEHILVFAFLKLAQPKGIFHPRTAG
ncbi:related to glyoxal oxidase [Elysia marginata]|uniref:Related to glyoxal oxidase n=1 Tax=Elysia marginata TaxID=1093978 RepID=A0AAV4HSK8_9GAST|nr:related to glyoxal oxidase [Elysia marginata]